MSQALPTGSEFKGRFIGIVSICGIVTALVVLAYLFALLRMPREQVIGLCWLVAGLMVIATPISMTLNFRMIRPVVDWLDRQHAGDASQEDLKSAFAVIANLPHRVLIGSYFNFAIPAMIAVLALWVWFETFQSYSALLMTVAVLSAGVITAIVEGYLLKRWLLPMRLFLTLALDDPEERENLTNEVSLSLKLQVAIAACTLVPVIFTVFMAHTRSTIPVESLAIALQQQLLAKAADDYEARGLGAIRALESKRGDDAFPVGFLVYDLESDALAHGNERLLAQVELEVLEDAAGSHSSLHSDNLFTWRPVGTGREVIVVVSSRSDLMGDQSDAVQIFGGLLIGCLMLAMSMAWLVAQDVGGATRRLRAAANRMADGDLRRLDVLESEDEMGTLARSFETMSISVNRSVGEVAEAADGVETASFQIAQTTEGLATAASEQGCEVKQVVAATEELGAQISGIAGSSRELNQLVEESTSSLLELGSSGEQLNQTAGVLSSKVDEVSSSVEQMVRSVSEVGRNTETLSEAASETSSSMEEIASSMRLVDATAVETAELSQQVVEAAERGAERVSDTIDGMESIRVATDTAQRVILSLGERTQEIGGILDVIDDVADETNLLALNAAIIAAQAGEHGKAFSVVADEIKELADRVLASTKEIGGLIRSLQEESQSAITAIDEGSQSVASGVERSTEAGNALSEITQISRDSGMRIREIVGSVQEQTKAAGHVVELMERVREGVRGIQDATSEQSKGNEVVYRSTQSMSEVSQQLHTTTTEQSRGLSHIGESVEGVRDAMERINNALDGQSTSCNQIVGFLEEVSSRSMASEASASKVAESTQSLLEQAQKLRDTVAGFQR